MPNQEHPVSDAADYVSAFMSLPEVLQSGLMMTLYSARDIPLAEVDRLGMLMKEFERSDQIPPRSQHYMAMCGHLLTALFLARQTNEGLEPRPE